MDVAKIYKKNFRRLELNFNSALFSRVFYVLLLIFLSILSVSGTIALRNTLHFFLLLGIVLYIYMTPRANRKVIFASLRSIPFALYLWILYLLLFPLFAPDGEGAFDNLLGKGMWGESILTWALAWGSFMVLGSGRQLGLWSLALVSATPVFIHLTLLMLAWAGVLQPQFYIDPSLGEVGNSIGAAISDFSLIKNPFGTFPMGFRGIEPMHGNLGYPASQTTCIALASAFGAWRENDQKKLLKSVFLVVLCFVSVVVAQSRAATYFGIFLVALAFVFYWIKLPVKGIRIWMGVRNWSDPKVKLVLMVTAFGFLSLILFLKILSANPVWYSMWDKMYLGFEINQPKLVLCEGFTPATEDFVRSKHLNQNEEYIQMLIGGLSGDGARVMMARAGLGLVSENLWGLNGDRDAYQRRMEQSCGHTPTLNYAHAHNAWINMALSLGVIAVTLYFSLLFNFARMGARGSKKDNFDVGIALFLCAFFWLIRGVFDAVYQEHYMQMQAFFLLYLYFLMKIK